MGFPVGYSEMQLPRLLLHLVLFLGSLRRFLSWVFQTVGLGDLLDSDGPDPPPQHMGSFRFRPPEHRRAVVDEALPVVRYEELAAEGEVGESCAVCLYDFEGGEEVRRLANCRHVFHRGCLDRWMGHEQRTCPLCRAPLMPAEAAEPPTGERSLVVEPLDYDYFDYHFPSSPSSPLSSPTLFLPHQLIPSS
ncbi:brassinosteroid-responsive RING protein 1-like [Typha latifolia]|uniref:brassinosteroid-responsive RING protein 1-like n=1 Tax=Typha latifolia TaxID=4733 RepID=UPI003C2AFC7A